MAGSSKLSCIGKIGDGCGGGREFFIQDQTLYAKDPITATTIPLLHDIKEPKEISKKGCIIIIKTATKTIHFNLSTFTIQD